MGSNRAEDLFDPAPLLALYAGMPAEDIAAALGVGRDCVVKWRSGERRIPRDKADQYAVRAGVHPGTLWPAWWN